MKLLKLRIGTMKHTQFFTPKMIPNSTTHVELKGGTRYGIFDINSGEGILSGHHSCGAEKFHLQQFINIEDINLNKSEISDLNNILFRNNNLTVLDKIINKIEQALL